MKAIALDTNLLALYVVGSATGRAMGKRLKGYTDDDIPVLLDCIARDDRVITTPNVWTEFFNIWDWGIDDPLRSEVLQASIAMAKQSIELVRPSRDVVDDPELDRLGLSDCVWLAVLDQDTTLLTDDIALYNIALSRGLTAVNFTHLRQLD